MTEAYAKAYFERLDSKGKVEERLEVQYNPTEIGSTKGAQIAEIAIPGIDSPVLQFVRGQNETVSLELFFDSTEDGTGAGATSVTEKTNRFYALVKMSGRDHAPPRCRLVWGAEFPGLVNNQGEVSAKRSAFDCVVESVSQTFSLFNPEGVPLRATLSVSLREYKTLRTQLEQLNLQTADHTRVHTVVRGETLPKIAHSYYGDPARWRLIAAANDLHHPRSLEPGSLLQLPPILRGASR
jgi:hypothetical protein